jgi:tetratricopeptide (TPR) repeat protein
MKTLFLLVVIAAATNSLPAQTPSPETAIVAYREALEIEERDRRLAGFAEAELLFGQVLAEGSGGNADLWSNLGNAALQAEHLGSAIHAYRSALRLDPDHRRARANLIHARKLLPSWVPRPDEGGALDTFLFWHRRLSPAERSALAALSFLAAAALVAIGIARRRTWLRNAAIVPLFGWGALLVTSPGLDGTTDEAVVVVEETVGRAADSTRAQSKFPDALPAGVEVRILEERVGWRRIVLADGREAWVQTSSVAPIGRR